MNMQFIDHQDNIQWISGHYLQHFLYHLKSLDLDIHTLPIEMQSNLEQAMQEEKISLQKIEYLLKEFFERLPQIPLGLKLAQNIQPATFGTIGLLFQTCATFSEALDIAVKYNGFLSNIGQSHVEFSPGQVHLYWQCLAGSEQFKQHATDYVMASLLALLKFRIPQYSCYLIALYLSHPAPKHPQYLQYYQDIFPCPVYFDQERSYLQFDQHILKQRLPHADALLKNTLEQYADQQLLGRNDPSLQEKVRYHIKKMLISDLPRREEIAAKLGMSGRSLHRKLQQQNTSYQDLLDDVRLDFAQTQFHHSELNIAQLATQLGFLSPQAFYRWFKKNSGMTTQQFRMHIQHKDK